MKIKQVVAEFLELVRQEKVKQAKELIVNEAKGREDKLADVLFIFGKEICGKGKDFVALCCLESAEEIVISENLEKVIVGVLSAAHYNYATSLKNEGNFGKAEEHYKKALEMNPGYADAHYKYANLLRGMKNFGKAEEHYKKALEMNSKLAGAHRNLGILYRDQKKYSEALKSFKKASNIFKERKRPFEQRRAEALKFTTRAILLWRDESWERIRENIEKAINNYKACGMNDDVMLCKNMLVLVTVDESFNESLTSESLIDLREKISKVYEAVTTFKEGLLENKMHEYKIFTAKLTCIEMLYKALTSSQDSIPSLNTARKTLREGKFTKAVQSLNCLENFVLDLFKYDDLETIPESEEKILLAYLNPLHSLDGYITTGVLHEVQKRKFLEKLPTPIQHIMWDSPAKKWVKAGIVQLHFTLKTKDTRPDFPPTPEDPHLLKSKFLKYLDLAVKEKLDIVCFPELSMTPEILKFIQERKIKNMVIIGGTYYKDKKNICPVIYNDKIEYVQKIHPSKHCEFSPINGKGMTPGDQLYFFVTPAEDFRHELSNVQSQIDDVDFLFVVSYNQKPGRFRKRIDGEVPDHPMYILQSNVAEINKEFGKSCIFGIIDGDYREELRKEGLRSGKYENEVSRINGEGMLIAEFNIVSKNIPTPTPVDYQTIRNIKLINE